MGPQWGKLDAAPPVRCGVSNSDIVRADLGLLVSGKNDFDAIEGYRGDKFFMEALGIGLLASSPTLRQRLDAQATALFEHIPGINERLLGSQRPDYGVLACGWVPLDVDTFAMNNGGTAKEGVGRTTGVGAPFVARAGVDGYGPAGGLPERLRFLPGVGTAPGGAALGPGD